MTARQVSHILVLGILLEPRLCPAAAVGDTHEETIVLDCSGADALDAATRDRFIALDRESRAVRLARSYLITNETGVSGKTFDLLGPSDVAKIRFDVPLPGYERGLLLIYNSYTHKGHSPETISINGHARPYTHDESRMLSGGWGRHDATADELKPGANEIVITGGGLHVDTRSLAGRSSRSVDGGKTFRSDALGRGGDWSGEYIVRLRVYGYPPTGEVTSPVLDPAVAPSDPVIRPRLAVRHITLHPDQEVLDGTRIDYTVRWGTTPTPAGHAWSEWQPIRIDEVFHVPAARYLQWRARLTTDSSKKTPILRGVRLTIKAEVTPPNMQSLQVTGYVNPQIRRSSYAFTWESDTPRIRYLREKYKLVDATGGTVDELDRQTKLRKWVSSQWKEHWDGGKYDYCPPWDALELLELAPRELAMGMCTHFACTYVQTAAAVGFNTRELIVDHHCLAEIWSNSLGKWILQDPGPGRGPDGYPIGFAYHADGKPLNALEMHEAFAAKKPVTAVPDCPAKPAWKLDDAWMSLFARFAIPLRNNHLSQPEPAELEHGHEQYHWDGYLWWTDSSDDPKYPEYSLLSNRVADFYFTLNQTIVDLQQNQGDTLIVQLDHSTPNFARYEAAIDEKSPTPVGPEFKWTMHGGDNTLTLHTVNTFGVSGPDTIVRIAKR